MEMRSDTSAWRGVRGKMRERSDRESSEGLRRVGSGRCAEGLRRDRNSPPPSTGTVRVHAVSTSAHFYLRRCTRNFEPCIFYLVRYLLSLSGGMRHFILPNLKVGHQAEGHLRKPRLNEATRKEIISILILSNFIFGRQAECRLLLGGVGFWEKWYPIWRRYTRNLNRWVSLRFSENSQNFS